jgi:D-alanine-D-alanine ligase
MKKAGETMNKKKCVAIIFGGKSGEHHVSLLSAASVLQAIDPSRYIPLPVGINMSGEWMLGDAALSYISKHLEPDFLHKLNQFPEIPAYTGKALPAYVHELVDVVFPVLHGTYGEDGTIQGMLEMSAIPYVGAGVLASAVGMDKAITKILFHAAGIPQAKYLSFFAFEDRQVMIEEIESKLGYPCFVKPANLGSSVGISKANDRESLKSALTLATKYDRKIVIEEFVPAREIEVAVLGNNEPKVSSPGEIISSNDFYDYEAKYTSGASKMQIPAKLSAQTLEAICEMALTAYRTVDGSGLARIDFFVRRDNGEILINEINTMPGFTAFSMYPKMWEHAGLSYMDLITELIELGIDRYQAKEALTTSR